MVPASLAASHELFSKLCHLIELRKGGAADDLFDRIVLTLVHLDSNLETADGAGLAAAVGTHFGVVVSADVFDESIGRLTRGGQLFTKPDGRRVLSRAAAKDTAGRVVESVALEDAVRGAWCDQLAPYLAPVHGQLWSALQEFSAKMFLRHGAETILVLAAAGVEGPPGEGHPRHLLREAVDQHVARELREVAEDAITGFFGTPDAARTKYVAQMMDGAFALFTMSLDARTAKLLRSSLPPLSLFLDTNLIFGLIGLREGPGANLARDLLQAIRADAFPVTLYYHEKTLREIGNTIEAVRHRLRSTTWKPAMSRVATQVGIPVFSDIDLGYHKRNAETPLSVEIYLDKFRRADLLLADLGLKLFREEAKEADTTPRALLVAEYQDYLNENPPDRPRTYEAISHDMTVLYSVRQRKSSRARNALEAGALFLSLDNVLQRFDLARLRKDGSSGSVILPRQFMQLLRPFRGGSEDFDVEFVRAFAVPQIRAVAKFSPDTTSQILARLNAYEGVAPETVIKILTDAALHASLRSKKGKHVDVATAVDRALETENQRLFDELAAAQAAAMDADRSARENHERAAQAINEMTRLRGIEDALRAKSEEAASTKHDRDRLLERLSDRDAAEMSDRLKLHRRRSLVRWVLGSAFVVLLAIGLAGAGVTALVPSEWAERYPRAALMIWLMGAGVLWAAIDPPHRGYAVRLALGAPFAGFVSSFIN